MQEQAQHSNSNFLDIIMSSVIFLTHVDLREVQIARRHVNYLIANPLNNSSAEFIAARNYLQQQKVKHFPLPALTYYAHIAKLMLGTLIFLKLAHECLWERDWAVRGVINLVAFMFAVESLEQLFEQVYKMPAYIQPYLNKEGLSIMLRNTGNTINTLLTLNFTSFFSNRLPQTFIIDGGPLLRANIENLSPTELKELYVNTFSNIVLDLTDVPRIRAEL